MEQKASQQNRIAQENAQRDFKRDSLGSQGGKIAFSSANTQVLNGHNRNSAGRDKRHSFPKQDDESSIPSAKSVRQTVWESLTEKENKDADYVSVHEKLSDPANYTGVQKHK